MNFMRLMVLSLLTIGVLYSIPAFANNKEEIIIFNKPIFMSLKSKNINLRTGPATRYPIEWVYKRAGLPIEVLGKFENWRKIKDIDGTIGWVIKGVLSKKRSFRALATIKLRRNTEDNSPALAKIESGAIGKIISCPSKNLNFCRVELQGYQGWLAKSEIWGVYSDEVLE